MNCALHPSSRQSTVSSNSETQLLIYLVKELSGCQNQTKIHNNVSLFGFGDVDRDHYLRLNLNHKVVELRGIEPRTS